MESSIIIPRTVNARHYELGFPDRKGPYLKQTVLDCFHTTMRFKPRFKTVSRIFARWMLKLSSVRMERAAKALAKLKFSGAISPDQLAIAAWPTAVGKRIAVHACPKALVRGSLVVEADDAIWQKQLFHLRFDILAKLTEVLGSGIVTDLEFRIASATPRRPPQSAQSHSETASPDEADRIKDPVMRILYKQARKRATKRATA